MFVRFEGLMLADEGNVSFIIIYFPITDVKTSLTRNSLLRRGKVRGYISSIGFFLNPSENNLLVVIRTVLES